LFLADGQTEHSLIAALRNFANKLKKKHIRTFGLKVAFLSTQIAKLELQGGGWATNWRP